MPVDRDGDVLTAREAAALLRVSVSQLYALTASRDLPHVRLSPRCTRFLRHALLEWLESRQEGGRRVGVVQEVRL